MLNVQHDPQPPWSFTGDTAPRSRQSRAGGGARPLLRPSARYWLPSCVAEQFWLAPRAPLPPFPKPRRVARNSSLRGNDGDHNNYDDDDKIDDARQMTTTHDAEKQARGKEGGRRTIAPNNFAFVEGKGRSGATRCLPSFAARNKHPCPLLKTAQTQSFFWHIHL